MESPRRTRPALPSARLRPAPRPLPSPPHPALDPRRTHQPRQPPTPLLEPPPPTALAQRPNPRPRRIGLAVARLAIGLFGEREDLRRRDAEAQTSAAFAIA